MWLRAAMLKPSKDGVVYLKCPLSLLSPLFAANMYLQTRSIMSLTLSMRDDSQLLCVSSEDKNKYKLEVEDVYLNLLYANYHEKVKEKWENAIDAHGLRRNVQCDKTSYFIMKKGSKSARFPSIFSFSATPCVLVSYFLKESTYLGNYSDNRYSFQNPKLRTIQVFKNSVALYDNQFTSNMNIKKNSLCHMYWYEKFLKIFGDPSHDIAPDQYLEDLFLLTWNLTVSPMIENEPLVSMDSRDLHLSPIDAGSLDVTIELHEELSDNLVCFFLGFYQQEIVFDKNGVPVME